jgi:hypothetical protein
MQGYAEAKSRDQIQILRYEEMISEDNPVRVIDAFVDSLDMIKLGFKYADTLKCANYTHTAISTKSVLQEESKKNAIETLKLCG